MKGEIAGGLGAGLVTVATGGTGLIPILGAGALGTTAGGAIDQKLRDEVTGDTDTIGGYLQRGAERGVDDLTFGVGLSALGKGAKTAYSVGKEPFKKATENLGELGGKVWDNSGVSAVLRHATTDNISGAETALNKAVQGEANALQGLVETRNALGESAYNKFVNETPLNIPKTKNETINKGIDFLNEKIVEPISQTTKKIISDSDLNQREANLFLSALGNKQNGAKIIKDSIANDPNAFEKAGKIFSKLNTTARENLIKELGESKAVTDIFKEYEKSVKNDYAQVVDTLSEIFKEPISTAKTQEIKRNILLSLQDSGYPLNSQYRTLVNETLQKPTDFKAWNELRNYTNAEIGKLTKNGVNDAISFDRVEALSAIKNKIDEAMEEIYEAEIKSPKFANASKELMEQARADYKVFKELETSELYRQISHGIKNENKMIETLLKANGNQNGVGLSEFLDILGVKSRAEMENAIIKSVIEKNTIDGVTNFKAINETLANLPIQTGRASSLKEYINTNSSILNNSSDILEFLNKSTPKTVELQQGIGSKIWGAVKVMFRNRVVNKLKSRLPVYGNNQALHNHIANAIKNSGDLETAIKNIEQMPTENLPSETAKALEAFKKDFANIKDEIRAEAKQDIKQTLKEMSDKGEIDILEMAKNIKPKQAENLAKNEPIKGDNFVTENPNLTKPKSDLSVEITANKRTMEHLGIDTDKLFADLDTLLNKHPELGKPSTIYKIIKAVQDEPNRYFKNNRPDIDLIAKDLQDGTLGKMGIVNQGENIGKIGHLSVTSENKKGREVERLLKKSKDGSAVETPRSTLRENGQTAGAKSTFAEPKSDDIIPQNAKQALKFHADEPNFNENLAKAMRDKEFKALSDEYEALSKRINEIKKDPTLKKYNTEFSDLSEKMEAIGEDLHSEFVKFSDPAHYQATIENRELSEISKEVLKKNSAPKQAENLGESTLKLSKISKDLSSGEIYKEIAKWRADKTQGKILVSKIDEKEAKILGKEFDFKGNYPLAREIRSDNIAHALKQHGDEATENARGQIAINLHDISKYQDYAKNADLRVVQDNNRILYGKQINGHYVVVEEVLQGQNKLIFFDMWKGKGKLNKEVLTQHQRPTNGAEPNSSRAMLADDDIISNSAENVKSPKEILDEIDRLHAENNAKFDLIKKETNEAKKEQLGREIKANLDKVKKIESGYFNAKMEYINSVNGNFLNELKAIKKDKLLNADQQTEAIIKTHQQAVKYFDENGLNLKNLHEFNKLYDEIDFIASRKRYDIQKLYDEVEKKYNIPNLSHSEAERAKFYKIPQTQNGKYMHEIQAPERLGKNWIILKAHAYGDNIWSKKDLIKRYTNSRHGVNEATEKVEKLLSDLRSEIEIEFKITPNQNFGTNYAEFYHDGIGAFNKIKAEKSGQVSGAFHRDDLGDIDLVWGAIKDENGKVQGYGLSKIVVKHKEITPEILDEAITNGELKKTHNGYNIIYKNYKIGLNQGWNENGVKIGDNKWIVTAYDDSLDKLQGRNSATFTKGEALPLNQSEKGTSISSEPFTKADNLALNSDNNIISKSTENINANLKDLGDDELIELNTEALKKVEQAKENLKKDKSPQNTEALKQANKRYDEIQKEMIDRFLEFGIFERKYGVVDTLNPQRLERENIKIPQTSPKTKLTKEQKEANLKEWHKDSHEITKNADGSPKVFYHGSTARGITEFDPKFDKSGYGFWFSPESEIAKTYKNGVNGDTGEVYKVYLNVKNPIDLSYPYSKQAQKLIDEAEAKGIDTNTYPSTNGSKTGEFKEFLKSKGYDGITTFDYDGVKTDKYVIVFDSSQIKSVKNKGEFNPNNPNIMHSNSSIGGGLLGGSVSGIQTDENGNITGFDPAKFALGFGAGFGAVKLGANASIKEKANAVKQSVKQKQMQEKGKKFAEFCNRALRTDNKAVFEFGEVSDEMAKKLRTIKNDMGQAREFDFRGYSLQVDSNVIRHIKNEHADDLKYLVNLGDIYEHFSKATFNYKRNKKGQTEVAIKLFKKYSNGELVAVEMVDYGNKILNLQTFYKVDKAW